ncbi:Nucleotidyltransferase domain-containing protein [Acetomicrobium thermoterrenum DSM 13490]|uniref:Nucleotidyltransferase domain-containing protein n=1 Tax=Acetomicrobium thermoterrenum DSM 13490 TaxID=1120987 RepID=A0A1H3FG59_9BACT|nr:nucleotidyltransferase domain-containing protein [Acetomicrobium thermoterrenum]SDX89109.1 Nucleotidyltransferase domain-containing protein [Acetomicrobium thermoterrenum DSM 13490]
MKKENKKEMEAKLRDFFAMQDIKLAFLIGSYAMGTARPDSDVDIAVLFGRRFNVKQVLDLKEQLTELVGVDVDLVVLDSVGPVMKMQALKTGILLHAEKGAYEQFFVSTVNEYDDLKYCRREIEENILRRRLYA